MRNCGADDCKDRDADGNCAVPGADGLSLQYVGHRAQDEYFFLERYVDVSRSARL